MRQWAQGLGKAYSNRAAINDWWPKRRPSLKAVGLLSTRLESLLPANEMNVRRSSTKPAPAWPYAGLISGFLREGLARRLPEGAAQRIDARNGTTP